MANSLYLRLNLASVIILSLFLFATGMVLDNAFVKNVKSSLRNSLIDQLYPLLSSASIDGQGKLIMPLPMHLPNSLLALPNSGLYAFVTAVEQNGLSNMVWQSPSFAKRLPPKFSTIGVGEKSWQELPTTDGEPHALLGIGYQHSAEDGVHVFNFFLMSELKQLNRQINSYRRRLWGGMAITATLLLAMQILISHWALKPLFAVSQEVNAIESGHNNNIEGKYPKEVKKLTDSINNLLILERKRQTRYRNALDDLAHSLKTPLAVLLSAVDEPEHLPDVVQEQSTHMLRIVERQLQRAGNATNMAVTPRVNLAQLVNRIIQPLSKIYLNKNIDVINHIPPALSVACDEADLLEMIGNLIDNAFKWGRSLIEIKAVEKPNHLTISIDDDGSGIDSERINFILLRGGRTDEAMPGSGIGLNLVADLVEAYQGQLRIEVSPLGGASLVIELKLTTRQSG